MTTGPRRRHRPAAALLALVLAVATAGCDDSGPAHGPDHHGDAAPRDPAAYAAALEQQVNDARADLDLLPLTHDACAATAAQARADALVGAPELTHAPLTDVIAQCAEGDKAAENLARSERPPQEVVDAWLASPGHAANIKDPTLTHGAIACAQDGEAEGAPRFLCSHVMLGQS